jgi:hypothetical protein
MSKESSLTTPEDRDLTNKWKPDLGAPPLTNEEAEYAIKELNNTAFVDKFPRVDKTYQDPAIPLQNYGLISFIPAKGATPNANGVFGFAKLRGNFASEMEASHRAEYIIRNVDSYHQIYHTYVGRPFPLTESSKYSAEISEVDIRKETTQSVSSSIREKKESEQKEVNDMKEREQRLLEESKRENPDPYEEYITLRVKKAQLSYTYLEHVKKLNEIRGIIKKTREQVSDMDVEFPDFKNTYYEKYMDARRQSGIDETKIQSESSFLRFLVEDEPLPGIDVGLEINPDN